MEDPGKWSVDKKIPLATVIGGVVFLVTQTATLVWMFSNVYYRVANLEDFVKSSAPQAAQIAVIQEKITTMQGTLQRLETWITQPRNSPSRQ